MKLTFCGAAGEVTGSCHLLEIQGQKYLIDCGLFQGGNFIENRNWDEFAFFNPAEIEAVIVTHAHLDHIGRLPRLIKAGFNGPIYLNPATKDLSRLVLLDAVEVMRYNERKNGIPLLFDEKNVEDVFKLMEAVDYDVQKKINGDLHFTLREAGHILGSAFVKLESENKIIVFSGDIGNSHVPIVRETAGLGEVTVLIMESTYGQINHEDPETRIFLLQEAIIKTMKRGGTLMIPAFSLERTQEILYELNNLVENSLIPPAPIFLDSPLAAAATAVYKKYPQYFDEAAQYLIGQGDDFFVFPGLRMTRSPEESKLINEVKPPKIIMAGSGMMNGGRILHHLLRYLGDSQSLLLIVSYQAQGTLGQRLLNGERRVRIFGQEITVNCQVQAIGAYSAHGDQNKMIKWVSEAKTRPQKIFLVHGDKKALNSLKGKLEKISLPAQVAEFGLSVEI